MPRQKKGGGRHGRDGLLRRLRFLEQLGLSGAAVDCGRRALSGFWMGEGGQSFNPQFDKDFLVRSLVPRTLCPGLCLASPVCVPPFPPFLRSLFLPSNPVSLSRRCSSSSEFDQQIP